MAITPAEVKAITGSTLDDSIIQPFIEAASCVLTRISECTEGMTGACYDQLEAYLSAHLLTTSTVGQASATIKQESLAGKYSVTYLSSAATGQGVLSTSFGQTANAMSGGCLAQLDKNPTNIFSIGAI